MEIVNEETVMQTFYLEIWKESPGEQKAETMKVTASEKQARGWHRGLSLFNEPGGATWRVNSRARSSLNTMFFF